MLSIFSCAFWSFAYFLINVYSSSLCFFKKRTWLLEGVAVKLQELFIDYGYSSIIRYLINIFFHSVGYLFTLFSFDTQNFLILIRSNLSILLLPLVFVSYSRNHCQMKLFYMFSSKSLIILTLTLRSWIHFELIFAYDIREGSNFTLPCRFPEHHLSKRIYFPH